MKVGDYIRYRDRIETDPEQIGDPTQYSWGSTGIVMKVTHALFSEDKPELAVEYLDSTGSFHLARAADVEIVSTLEGEEALWRMWGTI